MQREPLITASVIVSLAGAILTALVQFGLDLSKDQVASILGVVLLVAPIAVGFFSRGYVTPVSNPQIPGSVVLPLNQPISPAQASAIAQSQQGTPAP